MQKVRHTAFTALLNSADRALQAETGDADSKTFRISKVSSCMRQRVSYLLDLPVTDDVYDPDYDLAAKQGDLIHRRIQRQLDRAGLLVPLTDDAPAVEVDIAHYPSPDFADYNTSGHIDAVFVTAGGTIAILDIKTISVDYLQRSSPIWPAKLAGYEVQVQLYMHFFRLPGGEQITDAYIYVVARDNTKRRRLLHVAYDPELVATHLARLKDAEEHRARGLLPAPEPSSACRFCAYQQACPAMATAEDEPLPWEEAS